MRWWLRQLAAGSLAALAALTTPAEAKPAQGAPQGSEAEVVAALSEFSRGDPDAALYCTDAAKMMGALQAFGAKSGKAMPPELGMILAPGAPLSLSLWTGPGGKKLGRMRLQTTMPLEQLALGMRRSAKIVSMDDGVIQTEGASGRQTWRQIGDSVEVLDEGIDLRSEGWDVTPLVAAGHGAVGQPGCTVAINGAMLPKKPMPDSRILLHMPFESGQGMFFAASSPKFAELDDLPEPAPPTLDLRAASPPDALLVIGIALSQLDLDDVLEGEKRTAYQYVQRKLPAAGVMLAVRRGNGSPTLSAAIPMERQIGAWWLMRRLRSVLDKKDVPYERISGTELRITTPKGELFVTSERGRLLLSTDAAQIVAMDRQRGDPWLSGRTAELAAEYPIVLSSRILPGKASGLSTLPVPITIAVDMEAGILRGYLVFPPGLSSMLPGL